MPQIFVDIDRTQAESLGVPIGNVFSTLQSYTGSTFVNQFNLFNQSYQTYVQADSHFRLQPEDIERLRTRNTAGEMVPIGALASIRHSRCRHPLALQPLSDGRPERRPRRPASARARRMALMEQAAADQLPANIGYSWTGMSLQEQIVGNQAIFIFALSILLVYLVLAALYESWTNPMAVILAVPLALLGVVGAMMARQFANDMYCQIGIVLMIAMAAKNAILVVEFARGRAGQGRAAGRGRDQRRPRALPPDHDDLARLHPRHAAPGHRRGRGRRRPAGPGHGGARRHDLRHPVQQPVRAAVLRHAAGLQRVAGPEQRRRPHGRGAEPNRPRGVAEPGRDLLGDLRGRHGGSGYARYWGLPTR